MMTTDDDQRLMTKTKDQLWWQQLQTNSNQRCHSKKITQDKSNQSPNDEEDWIITKMTKDDIIKTN